MNVIYKNSHLYPFDDVEAFYDAEIDSFDLSVKQNEHDETGDREKVVFKFIESPWKDGKTNVQFKGEKDQHDFLPEWDIIYKECRLVLKKGGKKVEDPCQKTGYRFYIKLGRDDTYIL